MKDSYSDLTHYNFPINFVIWFSSLFICGEIGVQLSVFILLFFAIILIKACRFYEIKNAYSLF